MKNKEEQIIDRSICWLESFVLSLARGNCVTCCSRAEKLILKLNINEVLVTKYLMMRDEHDKTEKSFQ